ncbi:hypothetical protein LC607_35875 [Nostoc sp. CHAB 5824]|nr:hypothetical protein [Nostoc sp. CHAB 5824]
MIHTNLQGAALYCPELVPVVGSTPIETAHRLNEYFLGMALVGATEELRSATPEREIASSHLHEKAEETCVRNENP